MKDIKILLKKKKKKSDNMAVNITKIPHKLKNSKVVEYRKNIE